MNNALTLLGLIGSGSGYGYDLKQNYDHYFNLAKPLAFGQVYAILSRMIRDGYIQSSGEETGGGPDRKKYEITPEGRKRLEEWMVTPEVPSESLQTDVFAKTVIALLIDRDTEELLDIQRRMHLERMRQLTKQKQTADIVHILLCDYALSHIEADLRWMELTSARLNELRKEIKS